MSLRCTLRVGFLTSKRTSTGTLRTLYTSNCWGCWLERATNSTWEAWPLWRSGRDRYRAVWMLIMTQTSELVHFHVFYTGSRRAGVALDPSLRRHVARRSQEVQGDRAPSATLPWTGVADFWRFRRRRRRHWK